MCMVVRKKQLITFIMTVLMFHLSFIAFREEYFVGFLKIQRYAAIALIGLVFININAFIKKENCLINIILILLSVACGLFAVLYLFQEKFEKIILNPIVAIVLILFCDSLLFINSAILTWGPINSFIVNFLHEDTTLTGRMMIYQNVLKLLMMNPWFGFGAENNYTMSHTVAMGMNTQNGLADIIVSYGVVGACLILLLMVVSLLKRKEDYSRSYMALMYTFIIVSMVEITLGNYFLITLALLAFVENGNRSN